MKKILLLGGNGYIGSLFKTTFDQIYNIECVDINWFSSLSAVVTDFNTLNEFFIKKFDVVILLAGHSSVKMCDGEPISSFNNNVNNLLNLLSKLNDDQKFIYASSSSVYGHTDNKLVEENYATFIPNNYYDLSKQVADLYVSRTNKNYYGLRFGTVNGWSPNLRVDIMINSMVYSSLTDGHIKLYTKEILRPILGITDLAKAFASIIDKNDSKPGIYNLASFNKTSGEIAKGVSEVLKVPVIEYDKDEIQKITQTTLQANAYNFGINTNKFEQEFNFTFEDTIKSITLDLTSKFNDCVKTNRSQFKKYV
jgi:nucleoside-diphosphate-sugar epimerase